MACVGAVAQQEGAHRLGLQQRLGFAAANGPPVEAALLELAEGLQDELVLPHACECLAPQGWPP